MELITVFTAFNSAEAQLVRSRLEAAGIPAFNYGPGIPDLCHRADEYCPIANLGVVYENLARFLGEGAA